MSQCHRGRTRGTYDIVIQHGSATAAAPWDAPPPSTLYLQRRLMAKRGPHYLVVVELNGEVEGIDHPVDRIGSR